MKTYINGIGLISPQNSFEDHFKLKSLDFTENYFFEAQLPPIKEYLSPKVYRRMSKIVRMGIMSSIMAKKDANAEEVSGIIMGTGLGCIQSTEKFLSSMSTTNEDFSNPSAFINSTHNTIAGQIGLVLKNKGYNSTYSQEGISFENALLDAYLMTKEEENSNWIVGGIDELTAVTQDLYTKNSEEENTWGEGAGTFLISNKKIASTYAEIIGLGTLQSKVEDKNIEREVSAFLKKYQLELSDIDLILSGDHLNRKYIFQHYFFEGCRVVDYKEFCGNYPTAPSFALGIAAYLSKNKTLLKPFFGKEKVGGTVLIHSSYFDGSQGLILLKHV